MLTVSLFFALQGESKRGAEGGPAGAEDSDLERKRREAEALLQSVGITPDVPHGKCTVSSHCFIPNCHLTAHLVLVIRLMTFAAFL